MKRNVQRLLSLLLCLVTACSLLAGCGTAKKTENAAETAAESTTADAQPAAAEAPDLNAAELGEGEKSFTFTVIDDSGSVTVQTIHTNETTVGAALLDLGLIAGEESTYGLYVKTVKGVTADYDKDKTYWGFFINGDYASTGVDATDIEEGADYTFQICK